MLKLAIYANFTIGNEFDLDKLIEARKLLNDTYRHLEHTNEPLLTEIVKGKIETVTNQIALVRKIDGRISAKEDSEL